MRLPIIFLFLFAITTEYWLDVGRKDEFKKANQDIELLK